jgi:hypothetical protein
VTRHSQNGWPVVAKSACDQGPFAGVRFPNGILAGDVAVIARWQLERYEATVEPLVAGECWGWYDKVIEGSSTISNHAAACAWDINARKYPMGQPRARLMPAAKITACHAIIATAGGVLRWGGDYTGRPDVMHWEVVGTPAEAHAFANTLRKAAQPVETVTFSVSYPLLGEGDDDNLRPGYDVIRRVQRELKITDDGVWGPKTSAALGAKRLTETILRNLFAGTR